MIIGLVGHKGSGKDTVGAYLIKTHGFERRSFADPLKRSLAAFLNIPFHEVENLKNKSSCRVAVGRHMGDSSRDMVADYPTLSFREALQRYGTEAHRDVFGQDFWLDATLPVGGYYVGRAIVVTDCRFENEAARIRHLGGKIVRIVRPTVSSQDNHSSEVEQESIVADHTILNNGTVDELYHYTEKMLDGILEPF